MGWHGMGQDWRAGVSQIGGALSKVGMVGSTRKPPRLAKGGGPTAVEGVGGCQRSARGGVCLESLSY